MKFPILSNWFLTHDHRVSGIITNDPRFPDGSFITTTRIVSCTEDTLETKNTTYHLNTLNFQLNRVRTLYYSLFHVAHTSNLARLVALSEEVIELGQVEGMTEEHWHGIIKQVYSKPVGKRSQELGGVLMCLAAYLVFSGQDGFSAFTKELIRCEDPVTQAKIREKAKQKVVLNSLG